jgi:KipI family sensor histidine kinase inhibitor
MRLHTVGEDALLLYLGDSATAETSARVQAVVLAIESVLGEDLVDLVPSYASVLILYDPLRTDHLRVARRVRGALHHLHDPHAQPAPPPRCVVLPVYYAAEVGADLESLSARAGLSVQEVIDLHTGTDYRVYAIGFAPGFAYLGEVDERIAAPRLATPRARVARGSVGIAERQTAVYPSESPGGWNVIGRCPLPLFDARAQPPMPVSVGDSVRFESISRERFLALGGDLA